MAAKKGLIIVESPTKVRTLKRFLGSDYEIRASVGHIKDLPKKRLGVQVEKGFEPEYEIIRGKGKVVKELRSAANGVEAVYLAPDPDREGEAIAWHIAEELSKGRRKRPLQFRRVLFHELTKRAVLEALANPVELDRNKFDSQQARRILDRLVGYELSPLLWEKVKQGLSAGRVQSVALRLICDREKEIRAFVPKEYWTVDATLCRSRDGSQCFKARVVERQGEKLELPDQSSATQVVEGLKKARFQVKRVVKKEQRRHPAPPFITSTLQQEASKKLGFSAKKTMMIAQRLYEGVEMGDEGPVGLITYMRTDSTRIAEEAIHAARHHIQERFGKEYLPANPRRFKKGKGAQDAHEAIRPTGVERTPDAVARFLDKDGLALYSLIWRRFVASQMASAIYDQTTVEVEAGQYLLRASGSVLRFAGFTILFDGGKEQGKEDVLPPVEEGEELRLEGVEPAQHFTQPPPRYTEASLIKALEEKGIGRPSTYATILSTIRNKDYVRMEKRRFVPTELGMLVTDLLLEHFPEILDIKFTANMEQSLDEVEGGRREWRSVLQDFYAPFRESLYRARKEMRAVKSAGVPTEIQCQKCGSPLVIRYGRAGEFLGCSRYPECDFTSDFERDEQGNIRLASKEAEATGEVCDKCGRPMVIKKGRYGEFLACSGYPECKNARPISTKVPCPREGCDGTLMKRFTRRGKPFYGCSNYPRCDYAVWDEPVAEECPQCHFPILVRRGRKGAEVFVCPQKGCNFKRLESKPNSSRE